MEKGTRLGCWCHAQAIGKWSGPEVPSLGRSNKEARISVGEGKTQDLPVQGRGKASATKAQGREIWASRKSSLRKTPSKSKKNEKTTRTEKGTGDECKKGGGRERGLERRGADGS